MVALLGAKAKIMQKIKTADPEIEDNAIVSKLVAYSSGTYVHYT